jgi:glycosyltransferase involved in cell wall biosynthesis
MRIVHVTNYVVPEYGYEELNLARAQVALGHEVTILTSNFLHPPGIYYGVLSARFPRRQVAASVESVEDVRVVRMPSWELPGRRMWMRGLTRWLSRLSPDVVHCHNLLQVQTVRLAARKALVKTPWRLVVDDHMHSSVVRRSVAGRAFYAFHRAVVQPLLTREVDSFCAIADDTRTYLRQDCGVRADIELRPLGVDADAFRTSTDARGEWRRRLDLAADGVVFAYVGKVIEAKGVHVLVEAAVRLLDAGKKFQVLVVGDVEPSYMERIRSVAASHIERFRFHGSVPHRELPGVYASADVAVWPRQESMAVFEAMATSIPVVVSSSSGYAALVDAGPGLTFAQDSADDLAAKLAELFAADWRSRLGAAGRELVLRDYSWRRSAERYMQTYTERAPAMAGTP